MTISRNCLLRQHITISCSLQIQDVCTVWKAMRFRKQAELRAVLQSSICCSWCRMRRSQQWFQSGSTRMDSICWWQQKKVLWKRLRLKIMQMSERPDWLRSFSEKMINWSKWRLQMMNRMWSWLQNTVCVSGLVRRMCVRQAVFLWECVAWTLEIMMK